MSEPTTPRTPSPVYFDQFLLSKDDSRWVHLVQTHAIRGSKESLCALSFLSENKPMNASLNPVFAELDTVVEQIESNTQDLKKLKKLAESILKTQETAPASPANLHPREGTPYPFNSAINCQHQEDLKKS